MCLEEGKVMCIVPCGHKLLCGKCGDAGVFKSRRTLPYSECPVCREEMCEPYVMEAGDWEYLGGQVYDS